jgi:hypothetical protein
MSLVTALVGLLYSTVPGLRLACFTSTSDTQFLDMVIFKGERWRASEHRLLDLRVFAKAALSGFISGEGRRFVCLSSSEDLALAQTMSFKDVLTAVGHHCTAACGSNVQPAQQIPGPGGFGCHDVWGQGQTHCRGCVAP